ncbi:MAG: cytochrome P450 [Rhizobiaceae bacterium]|nr:cytochrome P450 [Rhizobiaceae bacterium]MCV0404891.1 cytochrome P450 [Rhizobiaceae bacterium]
MTSTARTASPSPAGEKTPPLLDVDPYSGPVLADPYPFFETLRETAAIVELETYGVYVTGRYEETKIILNDHDRFTAKAGIGIHDIRKPGKFRIPNRLLENDPPSHTSIRGVLTRILSPIVVRRWREHFEKEAVIFADRLVEKGQFDGVEDVAESYVLHVFPEAVGVELPRREALAIGEMSFNQAGPDNELHRAAVKKAEPYLDWYDRSAERESMRPGSIGEMLFEAEERGELEEGVATNMARVFVRGGMDTTIAGIGFTLNQLARNPDQWAILKADPSKARQAFEEAIRHESPSYVNFRTTTRETELSGYHLAADTKIGIFSGCANRDPRFWKEPERYDLTRDTAGIHVAFGFGTHNCIGQMIARLEAECILKALAERAESIELTAEPSYRPVNQLRTLAELPLKVTPRKAA